jgi:hypothetical protein
MKKIILPTITSTKPVWKKRIKEAGRKELKEIALFLTCLKIKERKEAYFLLEKNKIQIIPFVHLRSDMELWELDYLKKRFKTEVFNTHTKKRYPFLKDLGKYKKIIFIENVLLPLDEKEIKESAGICLDFSHLENDRQQRPEIYEKNIKLIEKYFIGCSHISAVRKTPYWEERAQSLRYDCHFYNNLSEFDYLKKYPRSYFPKYIALELENTIGKQLEAKRHIEKILKH